MAQITLHDYLQQTEDAISSSRIDDALTHCQFMLSYFPDALEIQRQLGEVYLAQERLGEAQHIFDWVLTNDPENVLAYCNRAAVSERMSEYDIALDCYQQAYELSRGNAQIRQEFNRLSKKVGQTGFMFSRAGLARLFMRGDLLSQAIQEWDAVLSTTPDRLDARTGQLETYWRAGQFEYVDQLAEQILHDVPGCLKALLLRASVIFSTDSQHAQELLQRAQALDPDFVQAQELFADALAKQPDNPFLQQLKKAPALLNSTSSKAQEAAIPAQPIEQQPEIFAPALDTAFGNTNIAAALAQWGGDASWSNDTTLVKPPSDTSTASSQNGSGSSWVFEEVNDSPSLSGTTTWNAASMPLATSQDTSESKDHAPEPWELLQNALNQFNTDGTEDNLPLWDNFSSSTELNQAEPEVSAETSSWLMPDQQGNSSLSGIGSDSWSTPIANTSSSVNEDIPATPSWLSMLNQADKTSTGSDLSSFTPESQSSNGNSFHNPLLGQLEQSESKPLSPEELNLAYSVFQSPSATDSVDDAESQPSLQSLNTADVVEDVDIDEESLFGPAWLKSLGATTLADEEASAITPKAEEEIQGTQQQAYASSQYAEGYNTSFARQDETFIQAPSTEYEEKQYTQQSQPLQSSSEPAPATNPYELWLKEGFNSSPDIHEHTSWESTAQAQQPQIAPIELPVEQHVQQEVQPENAEQNLVTTLEALEQSLRSKGFIPLEPNSLATVASQAQENSTYSPASDDLHEQEEYNAHDFQQAEPEQGVEDRHEELNGSSHSSALAQLENMSDQVAPPPAVPSLSSFESIRQNEEPSWLQALKVSAATPILPNAPIEPAAYADVPTLPTEQSQQYQQLQEIFSHFQPTPVSTPQPGVQELDTYNLPQTPSVHAEPIEAKSNAIKQAPVPLAKELQETVKVSALNRNPLLDGGLETTMKRPAVRLQPIQRQSVPPQAPVTGGAHIVSRTQSGARIEKATHKVTKTTHENLSYHDRLLKGYQHQLVGDYDEAMQEYRLIIRSTTELLGEVVSNVRALLKLAPNYAAGYRVLGDAYMRQGEYLQAMEAYNKALSITKKVK